MVTVFCAIVGVPGSVFSVKIDENESVAGLKKAIKKENPNIFQCNAMDLRLFLTNEGNLWLTEAHAKKGVSDTSGFKLLDAMKAKLKVVGLKDENDDEEDAEGEGIVDVLVVNPQERSFQSFQPQHEFTGAVPSEFQTFRPALVDSFMNLLFPSTGEYRPLLLVRAPPLSGKSTLCDLLCDRLAKTKPQVLVARVLASRKPSSATFSDYFKSVYNCELETFWDFTCDRVILIDEAQLIYGDDYLRLGLLKNTYERRFPGPRIVLFSSDSRHECSGVDFTIDQCDTFGLSGRGTKLQLKLSRPELDEMIGASVFAKVGDLIWDLSSAHIGVAHAMLTFLAQEFKNKPFENIDTSEMAVALYSVGFLQNFIRDKRGIPTFPALKRIVQREGVADDSYWEMQWLIGTVTRGEVFRPDEETSTRRVAAVECLVRFGFLYEDENKQLQFPSNMHLKSWFYSRRPDPLGKVFDFSQDDFIAACIKRMRAGALQSYVTKTTRNSTRERQIQLELYDATVPCLPRDVLVTPDWRTNDGNGCNDLVVRGPNMFWLWELLVNEEDDFDPTKRLDTLGRSYGRFVGSFKYVLIDFRQNKRAGHEKDGFLYVSFEDSYKKALISGLGKPVTTVELSGR